MAFLWRKQEKIEQKLERYFERCDTCFRRFEKAFQTYMDIGLGASFDSELQQVTEAESIADDLRRDIEHTLYGKALLPDSRGDILGLVETFDQIPGIAETILYTISCQRMLIPKDCAPLLQRLVNINLQAYFLVRKAVDNLLNNPRVTLHTTKDVEKKESESDDMERQIICQLFDDDEIETAQKILLKDLILLIGSISDQAEITADRISIIAIKRQI